MKNDLNLDTIVMANKKHNYDIDRLKSKSINNNKQRINGELYSKESWQARRRVVKMTLAILGTGLIVGVGSKMAVKHEVLDTYDRVLDKKVQEEMSYLESLDFLENYDTPKKEIYNSYVETIENLDDDDYTFFGNRKDDTHNNMFKDDPNSLIQLNDKQKDAIEELAEDTIEEYQRGK